MSKIALTIEPGPFFAGLRAMFREYGNRESEEDQADIAAQFDRTCADMCETWEQVRAATISAQAEDAWQPIETAPQDFGSRLYLVGQFCVQGFIDVTGTLQAQTEIPPHWRKMRGKPTHWMPTPKPPVGDAGSRGETK